MGYHIRIAFLLVCPVHHPLEEVLMLLVVLPLPGLGLPTLAYDGTDKAFCGGQVRAYTPVPGQKGGDKWMEIARHHTQSHDCDEYVLCIVDAG